MTRLLKNGSGNSYWTTFLMFFYQSDESVMSIMEVQAESDMISNYIEMYHLAPAKYMNQKHWLAVPADVVYEMENGRIS